MELFAWFTWNAVLFIVCLGSALFTTHPAILHTFNSKMDLLKKSTVDSRFLDFQGTLWNTSRYPYLDISDLQNWGKK